MKTFQGSSLKKDLRGKEEFFLLSSFCGLNAYMHVSKQHRLFLASAAAAVNICLKDWE